MNIGVLGGGQLGRMLALAGVPLGLRFRFLDPEPDVPASHVGPQIVGEYQDEAVLEQFAAGIDVFTFEFENVPAETLRRLARHAPVYPPPPALETAQDRLLEKTLFRRLDIPTPPFFPIASFEDLEQALAQTGYPAILKTRRFGYDGKGQWRIESPQDIAHLRPALPEEPDSLILEGFVRFDREVSLIAVRGLAGEIKFYPLVENVHETGILRHSRAPAPDLSARLQETAQQFMLRVLEELDYVGVLTIEFFQCGEMLLANEMAPRVHNSGHWTIEGAEVSQFENHLRAILGLPLGSCEVRAPSAMWNLLGSPPSTAQILALSGVHLHLYGKQPRPGRKIGHITICSANPHDLADTLAQVRELAPQS